MFKTIGKMVDTINNVVEVANIKSKARLEDAKAKNKVIRDKIAEEQKEWAKTNNLVSAKDIRALLEASGKIKPTVKPDEDRERYEHRDCDMSYSY